MGNEAETKTGVITLIMIKVNMIIIINPTKGEIAIKEHHPSRKDPGKEVRIETIDIDIDQKAAHRIHAGIGQDLEVHIEKCLPKVVDGVIHIQVMRETLEKKEMCDVMKLDGVKKKKLKDPLLPKSDTVYKDKLSGMLELLKQDADIKKQKELADNPEKVKTSEE